MDRNELIMKMQTRVERCRRLARACPDETIAKDLLSMAAEGEADIARLLAQGSL